jgi:hypothetical protein
LTQAARGQQSGPVQLPAATIAEQSDCPDEHHIPSKW